MAAPLPWLKPAVLVGGSVPGIAIVFWAVTGQLGADPIAEALNRLGLLALIFLVASLACTPAKAFLGWTWAMRLRRMLGLFAFAYAALHVSVYVVVDQSLRLGVLVEDLVKRPFILVGAVAFALLVPLAVTSTQGWVKRLGYVRWQRLHRLVYLAAPLAVVHFYWRVKKDATEPLLYAGILTVLLAARGLVAWRKSHR